ncbi:MAG: AraC family transcriptional regulator [Anaerolineales bacterium]|nr:AraC family transcriptional regulator [Anaerolineales bacterium]
MSQDVPALEGVIFHQATLRPPLDRYVEMVWAVRGSTFYRREVVLPNGAMELMLNYGSLQRVVAIGERPVMEEHRRHWLSGLQTGPLCVESAAESDLLSIRFRPGGAASFLGLPISELSDQVLPGADLFGRSIETLRERLAGEPDFSARVGIIEAWLLARLRREDEYEHRLVDRAISLLQTRAGRANVGDLCEELGLSNRHLVALFRRAAGAPPKTIGRMLRFGELLAALRDTQQPDWAQLAARHGYYDQSHLIHEFRAFSGVTPGEYLLRRSPDGASLVVS